MTATILRPDRLRRLVRTTGAALVVLSLSVVVSGMGAVVVGLFGLADAGVLSDIVGTVTTFPRPSAGTPLPPPLAAGLAGCVLAALLAGWERVAPGDEPLLPPSDEVRGLLAVVGLTALYGVVVELAATFAALGSDWPVFAVLFVVAVGFGVTALGLFVRTETVRLRDATLADTTVASADTYPRLVGAVDRLARAADVPVPAFRVRPDDEPLAFTLGDRRDAVVVVSTGLLDRLPRNELDAVLAHEVAHLANRDRWLLTVTLAPVAFAERTFDGEDGGSIAPVWAAIGGLLGLYGRLGVAVLSVGRERAADAAAAEITGDPAALASALARLSGTEPPQEDFRDRAALSVLNVLPTVDPTDRRSSWLFRTHPPTEERIAALRERAADLDAA